MKKYTLTSILTLICFSCIAQWNFVGPSGVSNEWTVDNDIKTDTTGSPVVIFFENSFAYKASCLRFNGTQWEQVGITTFDNFPIEYLLDFEIDNKNNFYILYLDPDYNTSCIRFNGETWGFVGSQYISTEYSVYKSLAIDTAGIVSVALQSQSGFSIVKENGESWIPVTTAGLTGVDRYFDLVFDNENVAYFSYCGSYGKVPNCAKLVNDNWEPLGSGGFSTYFAAEPHLLVSKDNQVYTGFEHYDMGFYKYDIQSNTWINVETDDFGEYFGGVVDIISDSNSNIFVSIISDRARCFTYNGAGWNQLGSSGISESEASYPKIALNNDNILYATYNDWLSGKAVVKEYDVTTGIDNVFQGDLFKLYPNPVRDHFCIELKGQKYTVMIFDTKGKLVFENRDCSNRVEFDAKLFDKGIYIVGVRSGKGNFQYQKLIVI